MSGNSIPEGFMIMIVAQMIEAGEADFSQQPTPERVSEQTAVFKKRWNALMKMIDQQAAAVKSCSKAALEVRQMWNQIYSNQILLAALAETKSAPNRKDSI